MFVVDTRDGLLPLDEEVARRLRNISVPVICIANKADTQKLEDQAADFYRLGRGRVTPVSTKQNRNRSVLLNLILERLPSEALEGEQPAAEPEMKVAIVGRRNVGKSTFVNTLAEADRMIVSEVAGTTRDSVDVRFELDGKAFVAIDTPGIRRPQGRKGSSIDFYGFHRAQRSVRRADVVFLFLDATQRISKVDKQLCDYISQSYKPCILVVNKWDQLVDSMPTEKWVRYLHDTFRTMRYAPIAFITGQTGKNVKALLNHGQMLFKQSRQRISTGQLNRLLREAIRRNPPPMHQNRRPKVTTQPRSAFNLRHWCCFAAIQQGFRNLINATCLAPFVINSISKKYPSSSTCANVSKTISATKSKQKNRTRQRFCLKRRESDLYDHLSVDLWSVARPSQLCVGRYVIVSIVIVSNAIVRHSRRDAQSPSSEEEHQLCDDEDLLPILQHAIQPHKSSTTDVQILLFQLARFLAFQLPRVK